MKFIRGLIQEAPSVEISDIGKLLISHNKSLLTYSDYKKKCQNVEISDIEKYHQLVGQRLSEKMVLRRTGLYYMSDSEED